MNLRQEILREHSKAQCEKIVDWVGASQERLDQLVQLFLKGEYRVTQRAAWPLSYVAQRSPFLFRKHLSKLVNHLSRPQLHDAVIRNTVRLLQFVDIPKTLHGKVMDTCFKYIEDPEKPVAIKVFSLTVVSQMARHYPDIIPEIRLLIEEQLPHQTAAFRSRAKRSLILLNRIEKGKAHEEGQDG
jgi:hypothetical protein